VRKRHWSKRRVHPWRRWKPPGRRSNVECGREREYLTDAEIKRLITAAGSHGRHLHRDATLILLCYRHGLRVSELVALKWSQVELNAARLHVRRAKGSIDGVHPLTGRELKALRKLQREQPGAEHLFMSERGSPMAPVAAQKVVRQADFSYPFSARKRAVRREPTDPSPRIEMRTDRSSFGALRLCSRPRGKPMRGGMRHMSGVARGTQGIVST
jgi:integrase